MTLGFKGHRTFCGEFSHVPFAWSTTERAANHFLSLSIRGGVFFPPVLASAGYFLRVALENHRFVSAFAARIRGKLRRARKALVCSYVRCVFGNYCAFVFSTRNHVYLQVRKTHALNRPISDAARQVTLEYPVRSRYCCCCG